MHTVKSKFTPKIFVLTVLTYSREYVSTRVFSEKKDIPPQTIHKFLKEMSGRQFMLYYYIINNIKIYLKKKEVKMGLKKNPTPLILFFVKSVVLTYSRTHVLTYSREYNLGV